MTRTLTPAWIAMRKRLRAAARDIANWTLTESPGWIRVRSMLAEAREALNRPVLQGGDSGNRPALSIICDSNGLVEIL
ncbi:MAG: hypothetical protein ACI9R3_004923 [Verrucomicrobiales bacterium]|jgi:hypothetical protein